jgi:hypothetical protein
MVSAPTAAEKPTPCKLMFDIEPLPELGWQI